MKQKESFANCLDREELYGNIEKIIPHLYSFYFPQTLRNKYLKYSLVTLVRNVQGYTRATPWYILEVTCTVSTICLQCWFLMVYVPAICLWCCKLFSVLWLYMSYRFCVVIYLITKIYLNTKIYFIGGWGGHGLTSTLCI